MKPKKTNNMKKAATILVILLLSNCIYGTSLNSAKYKHYSKNKSQKQQGGVEFGLTGGVNLATINGEPIEGSTVKMKPGFNVGMLANIGINKIFSIQPEFLFTVKGADMNNKAEFVETDDVGDAIVMKVEKNISAKLNYLELPILAKLQLSNGLNFYGGPYLSYLISAKITGSMSLQIDGMPIFQKTFSETSTEGLNPVDGGFVVGAGYKLKNGLGFSVRYTKGLRNLLSEKATDSVTSNAVVAVNINYTFGK